MSYWVQVLPGPVLCGICHQAMRQDDAVKHGQTSVVLKCWNSSCEQYEVPLRFHLPLTELEKVDV